MNQAMIKYYTSLEQSKQLAEFLPIESADMYYLKREINDTFIETPIIKPIGGVEKSLCCWSLAALLNCIKIEHNLHGFYDGMGNMVYRLETLYARNSKTCDNPVDAVYDMLFKLKEKNLL